MAARTTSMSTTAGGGRGGIAKPATHGIPHSSFGEEASRVELPVTVQPVPYRTDIFCRPYTRLRTYSYILWYSNTSLPCSQYIRNKAAYPWKKDTRRIMARGNGSSSHVIRRHPCILKQIAWPHWTPILFCLFLSAFFWYLCGLCFGSFPGPGMAPPA